MMTRIFLKMSVVGRCDSGKCSKIPSDTSGSNFLPCPLSDHCPHDDHHDDDHDHHDDDHDYHDHDHDIFTLYTFMDLSIILNNFT